MGPSAKDRILEAIDDLAPYLIEASKTIHRIAEPGFREFESSSYCAGEMQKHGFRVEKPVASLETAFRADFQKVCRENRRFLLRVRRHPRLGHGCGHNLIAASAMGAAIALRKGIGPLPGRVVVMGTPAEEGGAGKAVMIDQGVWDDVDICMEIHAHPIDHFTVSKTSNALQGFDIEFRGRGPKKGKPIMMK
jgi:metal-dependent amidase/aminoacylase/carboxypeptidase family protein